MDLAEVERLLEARIETAVSPRRAAHSRGVAALAGELCGRHGLDPVAGRVAGLAHDLCKESPLAELRAGYAAWRASSALPPMDEASDFILAEEILHGPAAATLLAADYGPVDPAIIEAVAFHTVGHPDMGLLATLVYCADKIEPGRRHVDDAFRSRCLGMEPRDMLLAVIEDSMGWLERKGRAVAPSTRLLYNALRIPVQP